MNTALIITTCLLLIFTILPLIRNEYWIFRVFDYPRLQKLILNVAVLVLTVLFYDDDTALRYILPVVLICNIGYLLWLIWPFTIFGPKQVMKATTHNEGSSLSIMIANVYQDNKDYKGRLAQVAKADPDLVILLETDSFWDKQTRQLENKYTYHCRVPLENTYGLLLYSKLELLQTDIKYLVEKDVPSIHTQIKLRNGQPVQLYAVHPTPPVPGENESSAERDKELLLVADMAKQSPLPVIVAGDLNDVAWSHTTELFLKMSELLDPRRGRGFFNSFNAKYLFIRFPLDHAFISPEFKLNAIKRLDNCGSDHFPIYLNIQLEPDAAQKQQPMEVEAEDIEEAEEKKAQV
ncbi:endonuclease/exonuclease/phosphatase family protein [Mucilaginibacter puniceus]